MSQQSLLDLTGLGNQTRREAARWWGTGKWIRQAALWSVMLVSLFAAMFWIFPPLLSATGAEPLWHEVDEAAFQFADLTSAIILVGVTILSHGVLIDDRRSGVMEWVLSKPLTRPALVLAKFTGQAGGLLAPVVLIPWLGVWVMLSIANRGVWPIGWWLGSLGLLILVVLFQISLVLALSVLSWSRGLALAVPIALIVSSDLVMSLVPGIVHVNPYMVGRIGAAMLSTGDLLMVGPTVATSVAILGLLIFASWRVSSQEF